MAIYDFFVSRNGAAANAASYIGHAGRLFYDSDNGVVKLSDGVTPGGTFIPYNIATTETIGGIKAGPGANVSVDGTLTIDTTGLPLGIGNLQITDNILSAVNANADIIIESNGTGNVELVGNVHFHTTAQGPTSVPYFEANGDGQITVRVPAADPLAGAFKIVGSSTGTFSPPINTGVMLQITGNSNDPSRIYNDSINNFSAYVGRRINGNVSSPTAVQAGDEIIRISSTGHNGTTIPGAGSARIVFQAKENYTTSAQGSNLSIWTTAISSNVLVKTATFDRETGLTVAGNITANNLSLTGDISYNPTYGCFHKQANVTAASSNTVYAFDWYANTHVHEGNDGVTVSSGTPSRVYIDTAGDYMVSVEMQIVNIDNAERVAYVWLALDGTDVSHSSLKIGLRPAGGGVPSYQSIFQTWTVSDVSANSYIEMRFAVDNTSGISVEYSPSISSPYVRPATPSATFTITPV